MRFRAEGRDNQESLATVEAHIRSDSLFEPVR